MRISIAMTTYNGAKYLQAQLDSFRDQTRLPDELVVCDDGSSDDTMQILSDFQKAAPFEVVVERNAVNLGFTKNFEKAVSLCTGDIVFLSDQDDIWFADKIEQVETVFIQNQGFHLVIHDGEIVDDSLVRNNVFKIQQVIDGFGTDGVLVMGGLTAIRRELLEHALPIPAGIIGHDVWFHEIARFLQVRFVFRQCLQLIRRHGENTSNWIASSGKRINKLDVFLDHLATKPAESYEDRLVLNSALAALLKRISDTANPYNPAAIGNSLEFLDAERNAIEVRNTLIEKNFTRRVYAATRLLFSGGYSHFNGVRSFFRDLFR
jgi:glycosyltransferase involved in cell wall biosynthesis